jgi:hypothetical protein
VPGRRLANTEFLENTVDHPVLNSAPALAPAPRSGVRTKVFSTDLTVYRDSANKALKEHDIACDICDKDD